MSDNAARLIEHQQLVNGLLSQALARGEAPVVIATGISTVLLIGGSAYKLRKPVRLDFLDFSHIDQRHHDCEAEWRLNQRTAADLYLGVVPVRGSVAAPQLGGDTGEIIDWALQMRRFDPAQCFDRLAARQQLTALHAQALGEHLGRFHAALPASPPGQGEPAIALHWADANFTLLRNHPMTRPWWPALAQLERWTREKGSALAPLMARRKVDGWVREGHGDLHLGNLLWQDDHAVAFDAIEFDASLRHVDVISDIAFTWMDLHRHGLPALAARFLDAYLETLGDLGGLALLRWYAVYRALVRAKVALLRAVQADSLGHPCADDLKAVGHDIAIALSLLKTSRPMLIAMTGLSGSGKSTVAIRLVERLGAVRLRSDVERKRLFGLPPLARDTEALYTPEATTRTYARLEALATQGLQAGWPVVIDAANLKRAERERWRALAAAYAVDFVLMSCEVPVPVLQARLQQRHARNDDPSDATPAVLEHQLAWHEPVAADEAACHFTAG